MNIIQTMTMIQRRIRGRMMMGIPVTMKVQVMLIQRTVQVMLIQRMTVVQVMIRIQIIREIRVLMIFRSPFSMTGIGRWCLWGLSIQLEISHARSSNSHCHLHLRRSDLST
jgi:hypothetical protein